MIKPLFDGGISINQNKNKGNRKAVGKKKSSSLAANLSRIMANVNKYLGKYKDVYKSVLDEEYLNGYIDDCIKDGIVAYDTETTGLDPISDKIVGFSLYCPSRNYPIYVPINHVSYMTGIRISDQLNESQCHDAMQRMVDVGVKNVMFNAPFDIRVSKHGLGVPMNCDWDCSLAAHCLNENEEDFKLKHLYKKYVLRGKEDAFAFDELFNNIGFDKIPLDIAYLYGAHDAIITFKYYLYQLDFLGWTPQQAKKGLEDVSWVFHNIEMPCVAATAEIEDTGVCIDTEYAAKLHKKYSKKLTEARDAAYEYLDMYKNELMAYNGTTRLDTPINLDSPKQIAVVLYDIIGCKPVDKKNVRGTGEEILSKLDNEFADYVLTYRGLSKLMGTYIDKLPDLVNHKTGRLHCNFWQYGARTGRFSSSNPNLQNIPSHNKDIRPMFKATEDVYCLSTDDDIIELKPWMELQIAKDEWIVAKEITNDSEILVNGEPSRVKSVSTLDNGNICVTI